MGESQGNGIVVQKRGYMIPTERGDWNTRFICVENVM